MIKLETNLYFSGWLPEAGKANSYFVKHEGRSGNWLINCPKVDQHLIGEIEALGGVNYVFATHRDVVGHISDLAKHFNAKKIIHEKDLEAIPEAEIVVKGQNPVILADDEDWLAIPTAGHTEGHCMLLYRGKYLFAGDALKIEADKVEVESPAWTWDDYDVLVAAIGRLTERQFSWVLPDHGESLTFAADEVQPRICAALEHAQSLKPSFEEYDEDLRIYIEQVRGLGQPLHLDKMIKRLSQIEKLHGKSLAK